ncbi:hypothetical protein [Melittangium boletus]|uniref:Carboxypeptidase regulatory-like domain-containing protein n=1 Tax=Melittangium boletus DSM 14713 TaxID=1294270 RepID=A0A250IBT7_9BACT|nr:hypothetical protein [Melittangium boletus]ATB29324.1 hypothetical protein MEBOL_002773 [Melittangium boletus DSM 14713]
MKTPALLLVPALLGLACGEGMPQSPVAEELRTETAAAAAAVFSGLVRDSTGAPVVGARVTVNGVVVVTNSAGAYSVSVVDSRKGYVFDIRKDGYGPVNEFKTAGQLGQNHVLARAFSVKFDAQKETVVQDPSSGIRVLVPAGSLGSATGVPATGPVTFSVVAHGPNTMLGDWTARNAAGAPVALETVGAMTLSAVDANGNTLTLLPGRILDVRLPVPAAIGGTMPACVLNGTCRTVMWRFDPKTGLWNEPGASAVTAQFSPAGTSLKIIGIRRGNTIDPADGLGSWNADIEHTNPACTIIEFVNIPLSCYNPPPAASVEPGIELGFEQMTSGGTPFSKSQAVRSSASFVVLYNLRGNTAVDLSAEFPPGAPAWCAGNLSITSTPGAAAGYPQYWSTGGRTRFNSGTLTFVGYPKNSAGNIITQADVAAGDHPCGSHVYLQTHP